MVFVALANYSLHHTREQTVVEFGLEPSDVKRIFKAADKQFPNEFLQDEDQD
jgi:hypothetical protein